MKYNQKLLIRILTRALINSIVVEINKDIADIIDNEMVLYIPL